MDWTTLLRSQQSDFIQKLKTHTLKGIQRLSKPALSIFLALLINMTGGVIPGVPLTSDAEALPINKALPPSRVKNTARGLQTDSNVVTSWSSFLSDNSIFRNTLELAFVSTVTPTFAPVFAPSLSLFRFDFYFDIKEFNLVKIINAQPYHTSPALEYYKQGVEKTQKGDYKGAVKYYSEALSKDHNFAEAYVSRGRAYSELGDQRRAYEYHRKADEYQQLAIKDYTDALNVKPKFEEADVYVEPLLGRGAVEIKLGDYQAALDDFSLAIQRNPNFDNAYLGRSTIYLVRGDYQKAINDLNVSIALIPDYPAAYLRRGSIWGELGEYKQAISDFTEVIHSQEEDASRYYADAYYKRGLAYLNLGKDEQALDNFNEAINYDPNYREAYYNRGIIYERYGDYKKANNNYSKALLIYNIKVSSWHTAAVHSVAISPDDEIIASGSDDGTIKLWNMKDGQELKTLYQPSTEVLYNWIQSVAFSPDGKTIAAGSSNRSVRVWNVKTGREIQTFPMRHSEQVVAVAFSPDGQILASGGHDNTIKLWNGKTGEKLGTSNQQSGYVKSLAFSPDGKVLASGDCGPTIKLWDWQTGEVIRRLEGHDLCFRAVAFSPDGQTLAIGSGDHNVVLWKLQSRKSITPLTGHTGRVTAVAFSPDGRILASGSNDKTIKLWDLETEQEIVTLSGHESYVKSVAFSSDGKTLVSGGYDKTVKVWQVP